MKAQSELLETLRAPEDLDPGQGFYARVLQRIEERAKESIWAVFIYSPLGKRLVYASLAITLMLCTYVVTQESRDGHLRGEDVVAQDMQYDMQQDAPVTGSRAEQRDAVLVNFATHLSAAAHEGSLQ